MKNYKIEKMTINAAAAVGQPAVQDVRGKVWDAETSTALVRTYQAGGYIPPVVFARLPGGDLYNADGQQRLHALATAVAHGLINGEEEIEVAIEDCQTEGEVVHLFHRLNSGVPVGKAIVAASGLHSAARDAVLRLAGHPHLHEYFDASAQARRTGKACDVAMSILACAAGWESPDSMSRSAAEWISSDEGGGKLKAGAWMDAVVKAERALDIHHAAAARYAEAVEKMSKKDDAIKVAKATLAMCRRKNLCLTAVSAILSEADVESMAYRAAQTLALYSNPSLLNKPVTIEGEGPRGGKVKATYHWTIGRGSSGSASEFRDRCIIIHAHDNDPELITTAGLVPEGNATTSAGERGAKKASAAAVDAVAAAFGL